MKNLQFIYFSVGVNNRTKSNVRRSSNGGERWRCPGQYGPGHHHLMGLGQSRICPLIPPATRSSSSKRVFFELKISQYNGHEMPTKRMERLEHSSLL